MERRSNAKLDFIKGLERVIQDRWRSSYLDMRNCPNSPIPSNLGAGGDPSNGTNPLWNESDPAFCNQKYFVCFPFPYMNGRLHLGHTFSLSKCEFMARYKTLQGYDVLFPFGFHCTGMPIKACADKLKREMELYGTPPTFPEEEVEQVQEEEETEIGKDKAKGKKSKVAAKTGGAKWQWDIMASMGIALTDIPKFADPQHWLHYFPPLAIQDLKRMGLSVDWRRSFITTDVNRHFDSFVRWQFRLLKERNRIDFGKRYCIFSPKDDQPCMDHDRSSGEGVAPQEYTLVKMTLQRPYPSVIAVLVESGDIRKKEEIHLVAATLRPETMYGQTNCWVHPEIEYLLVRSKSFGILVCSKRSARNMAYQEFFEEASESSIPVVGSILGSELINCMVSSKLSHYKKFRVFPLLSIKEDKGTGVVTSVPAEAPDDFVAFQDVKTNEALCETYSISQKELEKVEPVPVCVSKALGEFPAVKVCTEMGITSPNDTERLRLAKEKVYLTGYYDAVMFAGPYKGEKVQDVKKKIQEKIIADGNGMKYLEPEKEVISRSADECVVALCDQWFLKYGDEEWKAGVRKMLENMELYHGETRRNFEATVDWLQEHACSRTYGLGTRLPWDEKWLIESLSDSTIYMAYYTVKHLVEGDQMYQNGGLPAELMNDEVWDYIFFPDAPYPPHCRIDIHRLNRVRNEFKYWYPVDLRVSGKDLVPNHLTYYLYNHLAIWPEDPTKWPQSIRANGHLLLNSEKMSKSTGNFMTLYEALDNFGADATRLCLADAGDSVEDANFVSGNADSAILRLHALIEWVDHFVKYQGNYRIVKTHSFQDEYFRTTINDLLVETEYHYERMMFKEALKSGFFAMQMARDKYRDLVRDEYFMNRDLLATFIEYQIAMLSPICPHVCDYLWMDILRNPMFVSQTPWPRPQPVNPICGEAGEYVLLAARSFRLRYAAWMSSFAKKRGKSVNDVERPTHGYIYYAKEYPTWQGVIMNHLQRSCIDSGELPDNKVLAADLAKKPQLKKYQKKVMPFVQMVKERCARLGIATGLRTTLNFDEKEALDWNHPYLLSNLDLERIEVRCAEKATDEKIREECIPGEPFITFAGGIGSKLCVSNPQPNSGYLSGWINAIGGDRIVHLKKRMVSAKLVKSSKMVDLFRYKDPFIGPRQVPEPNLLQTGRIEKLNDKDVINITDEGVFVTTIVDGIESILFLGTHLLYFVDLQNHFEEEVRSIILEDD